MESSLLSKLSPRERGSDIKLAIDHISWEEKLRALEELWEAITQEGNRFPSPD